MHHKPDARFAVSFATAHILTLVRGYLFSTALSHGFRCSVSLRMSNASDNRARVSLHARANVWQRSANCFLVLPFPAR